MVVAGTVSVRLGMVCAPYVAHIDFAVNPD
jgi:hypothetical protein